MPAQPPRTSTPTPAPRGIKREFEDSTLTQPNAQGPAPGAAAVNNSSGSVSPTSGQVQRPGAAKAGVPGARPRPLKKQRVVSYHFTLSKTTQSGEEVTLFACVYMCSLPIAMLRFVLLPPRWPPLYSEFHIADLYLPVINRTCKARRGTCIRICQYSNLLHRACDFVPCRFCPFLKRRITTCCWALVYLQVTTRCKCTTQLGRYRYCAAS